MLGFFLSSQCFFFPCFPMQVLPLNPHHVLFIVRHLRQCTSSSIIWSGWVGGGEDRRSRSPKYKLGIRYVTMAWMVLRTSRTIVLPSRNYADNGQNGRDDAESQG
jgi:hypothetical protein